jgi:hypothetical protein
MLKLISFFHSLRRWFLSLCYSTKIEYSALPLCKHLIDNGIDELCWQTVVPDDSILLEGLIREELGEYQYKYRVFYEHEHYTQTRSTRVADVYNSPVEIPWLWIGDSSHSMGSKLSQFLIAGNVIKPILLKTYFPEVKEWKYLDPKTFEITDFPAGGITIKGYDTPGLETTTEESPQEQSEVTK